MKHVAITYTPYLARLCAVLAAVVAVSALLYGVFLLEAVANTAKRAAAEHQVQQLAVRVSTMESDYLSSTRDITPKTAEDLGFVPPTVTTTVYANAHSLSLGVPAR